LLKWIGIVPVAYEKSSIVNPDKKGPKKAHKNHETVPVFFEEK
jgi:hypothetical protein